MMAEDEESTFTLEDALARLEDKYQLIYVDYRDQLSDDQVNAIVSGDTDHLFDSTWEWESDARWHGFEYVRDDTFTTEEWDSLSADDQDEVRYAIEERDESDWLTQLVRHTPNPLLRVTAIDEDHSWAFEEVDADTVLDAIGFEHTAHNVATVQYALDNASPEFSIIMGSWVFSADLETIYGLPDDCSVTVTNPHLWLGNPFAGSGWLTDDALDGTVTITRSDIRTDRSAWGYSIEDVYGGLCASDFQSAISTDV